LKGGFVKRVREEIEGNEQEVDEALAERGREVCTKYGIEVSQRWDGRWREKVLEKEGRIVEV
jgi:hypothetical protein